MRFCEMCGCDISERHSNAKFCYKCVDLRKKIKDKSMKQRCPICDGEIPYNKRGVRHCPECACKVRELRQKVILRHNTIDICLEGCYVTKDDAYINLAGAIVRLTLEDYEYALAMTIKYPQDIFYIKQVDTLLKHMHSEYFDMLCLGLDPDNLIRDINTLYYGPKGY